MKKILNLGCGTLPLKSTKENEYTNIDVIDQGADNYIKHDLVTFPYPFISNLFHEIYLFHTIEHIPENYHAAIATELHRLIRIDGKIIITYPEFIKCADAYKANKDGRREYWKATIYGRGYTEADRHKALMDTPCFIDLLGKQGLKTTKVTAEKASPENTILCCVRVDKPLTYEHLMQKEFEI